MYLYSIVDEVKWGLRLPTRYASSEESLDYEERVQDQVLTFVKEKIKHDYLEGSRELNLDLTLEEAELLTAANEEIRSKADSGELQALHKKCADLDQQVQTQYLSVMDELDRVLQKIEQNEETIYSNLRDLEGLDTLKPQKSICPIVDTLSLQSDEVALENY